MTLTIGVLGGMGPEASADFYRRITLCTLAAQDQDHLHVIIDSDPSVPDRSAHLKGQAPDPVPVLKAMAQRLVTAGAELLVMACNTAHAFRAEVAASVQVPLVDWIAEAARSVATEHPPGSTIGVLATSGTLATGLYQEAFEVFGLKVMAPDSLQELELMDVIYGPQGIKAGAGDPTSLTQRVALLVEDLGRRGAVATLLACTELSCLYPHPPALPSPVYDTSDLVARRVITMAGGQTRVARG